MGYNFFVCYFAISKKICKRLIDVSIEFLKALQNLVKKLGSTLIFIVLKLTTNGLTISCLWPKKAMEYWEALEQMAELTRNMFIHFYYVF